MPPTGRMTLEDVVGAVQPLRVGGKFPARTPIGAVSSDSREVAPGGLFIALPGERVDGAAFVEDAFRKGALAALVSEEGATKVPAEVLSGKPVFVVRNSVEALGDLAQALKELFRSDVPVRSIAAATRIAVGDVRCLWVADLSHYEALFDHVAAGAGDARFSL